MPQGRGHARVSHAATVMFALGDGQIIPPDGQRFFGQRMGATVEEIASSHVALVSHADATTALIEAAAGTV